MHSLEEPAQPECCNVQVMQDLEAKAEVVREQARTHAQVVAAYDRVNANLQLANSEGHMYKTRIIQLEAEAKRDANERRSADLLDLAPFHHNLIDWYLD